LVEAYFVFLKVLQQVGIDVVLLGRVVEEWVYLI
jgi:hypothetical protein